MAAPGRATIIPYYTCCPSLYVGRDTHTTIKCNGLYVVVVGGEALRNVNFTCRAAAARVRYKYNVHRCSSTGLIVLFAAEYLGWV